MSPTILALLLAAAAGLGLMFFIAAFLRKRATPLEEAGITLPQQQQEEEKEQKSAQARMRRVLTAIERELRGKTSLVQDAKMVGRTLESHAVAKMAGLVIGAAFLGGGGFFLTVIGVNLPALIMVTMAGVGALLGWWLPDSILSSAAEKERVFFQQVAESWLELAGQLVTAGADTFAALHAAAGYSNQPVFITLREALRAAAARGEPPWTGLRRLADERRLRFLDPFCAALELAGTTGAGSRQTILAQVDAARSKAIHEADARAAAAGEKMGAPLALIGGAFMVLMGYPPLAGIMSDASITGGGL